MLHYTVHPGDTLWGIAQKAHTTWQTLWHDNRSVVHNPNLIHPGQVLAIRGPGGVQIVPAPKATPPPAAPTVTTVVAPTTLAGEIQAVFGSQAQCAANIVQRESGGNVYAVNPSSGAYGLPQANPGSKMASAGADWRTNGLTQLKWMKSYVATRYGGACAAWTFWKSHFWY